MRKKLVAYSEYLIERMEQISLRTENMQLDLNLKKAINIKERLTNPYTIILEDYDEEECIEVLERIANDLQSLYENELYI